MRSAAAVVLLWSAAASAADLAIAPLTTGQSAPPELQRAFGEQLPRALVASGFKLLPPNEVDMKVAQRPEILQCRAGGCLAEEAAYLGVGRLVLPRLERATDGGFTLGLAIYDVAQKKSIDDVVDRVDTPADLPVKLASLCDKLRVDLARPGRLEVAAHPAANVTVDGQAKGATPWAGELAPGAHLVALEAAGARVERDVSIAPGATARVDVELAQAPPPPSPHRSRALKPLKWTTLVAGLLAAGAGAALVTVDGRGTCSPMAGQKQCPEVLDTRTGGIVALSGGGALVVTSVVLFALDRPRGR